jgi:hypothetical protein
MQWKSTRKNEHGCAVNYFVQKSGNLNRLLTAWPTVGAAQLMRERIRLFEGQRYKAVNPQEREVKLNDVWVVFPKTCSQQRFER